MKFAIIGLSRHVQSSYLEFLTKNKNQFEIVAVCELQSRIAKVNKLLPSIKVYLDSNQMFALEEIDAVIISTPHDSHFEFAFQSLSHGNHVFVDKPTALSKHDIETLFQKSKEVNKVLLTAYQRRYSTPYKKIKEVIKNKELGELLHIDITYYRPIANDFKSSWRNSFEAGGGILMDAGIHFIDFICDLVPCDCIEMKCELNKMHYDVDVMAHVIARFDNGVTCSLNLGLFETDFLHERVHCTGMAGNIDYRRVKHKKQDYRTLQCTTTQEISMGHADVQDNLDLLPLNDFIKLCNSHVTNINRFKADLRVLSFIEYAYKNADYTFK